MSAIQQVGGKAWHLYNGDCCEVIQGIPDNSIQLALYSPPFSTLYVYSDSDADMGNCADNDEFFEHYKFLLPELLRVTVPGRLCLVHCKDLPKYANRDDTAGLIDFPGQLIRAHEECGWSFHSRVTIWKCPVTERERTNNNGLLHKTVKRDRSQLRMGMADYLLAFRKIPAGGLMSDQPIRKDTNADGYHDPGAEGFQQYIGTVHYRDQEHHPAPAARKTPAKGHDGNSIDIWRRYAEPVWWDINQTRVLNSKSKCRDDGKRHICLAAGTLVLTQQGYKPIESVQIGDMTVTHLGRWRPVIAKQCTGVKPVVQVEAQGVPLLRLTPDHNLWTRLARTQHPRIAAKSTRPQWVPADCTKGSYVNLKLPEVEESSLSAEEWRIVGRWLADGHWDLRGGLIVSCGNHKRTSLSAMLGGRLGAVHDVRTGAQIRIKDADGRLREMIDKCGRGAANKVLPREAIVLQPDLAAALLSGYLSGDGHYVAKHDRWTASSVSRPLLLGMAMVAQRATGVAASVYAGRPAGTTVIEGRTVNTLTDWVMGIPPRNVSAFIADDGAWKKVRKVTPDGTEAVWSLQVEEDASFTAEGCIVKNCPLQLDVIERAIQIWSEPDDVVLSPFAGYGSEGVGALTMGRRFVGIELSAEYYEEAASNLRAAEESRRNKTLF